MNIVTGGSDDDEERVMMRVVGDCGSESDRGVT